MARPKEDGVARNYPLNLAPAMAWNMTSLINFNLFFSQLQNGNKNSRWPWVSLIDGASSNPVQAYSQLTLALSPRAVHLWFQLLACYQSNEVPAAPLGRWDGWQDATANKHSCTNCLYQVLWVARWHTRIRRGAANPAHRTGSANWRFG